MFTGIIESTAKVLNCNEGSLVLRRPTIFTQLTIGQSIAVNGACLSIVRFDSDSMTFDVVPETFTRTNLSTACVVNLERAMPANGRFEGHIVLGHVDGTAECVNRKKEGNGERFVFSLPRTIAPFVIEKGSITINGISLTIASASDEMFEIAVIPHTLEVTNLGTLQKGDLVNVEADYLGKLLLEKNIEGRM